MPARRASDCDETAIVRARAGDRAAFDALYEEAVSVVWDAAVAGTPQRVDAESMAGTALMEAFAALPELPAHADFSAHCLRILARVSARTTARAAEASATADP